MGKYQLLFCSRPKRAPFLKLHRESLDSSPKELLSSVLVQLDVGFQVEGENRIGAHGPGLQNEYNCALVEMCMGEFG